MSYADPIPKEVQVEDRYGDTRVIHRTPNGWKLKRTLITPALALNQEIAGLVGQRIRKLRIARGYTLEELCLRAGLRDANPKARMWRVENSVRKEGLRLGSLYAIAMALDVEAAELLPTIEEVRHIAAPKSAKSPVVTLR